jgi:hypothetical protein
MRRNYVVFGREILSPSQVVTNAKEAMKGFIQAN